MQAEEGFLERENKAKILAQQEVIVLKDEIIRRKTIVNILVASVGIVILGLFVIVVRIIATKGI